MPKSITPCAPPTGALVQHYKGGLYRVVGACTVEATLETAVLYKSIDPLARLDTWMRPLADFFATGLEGTLRFSLIEEASSGAMSAYVPELLCPRSELSKILALYQEPHRFLHSEQHLFSLFDKALAWSLALSPEQIFAILMHDAVYVPGAPAGQNEAQSVQALAALKVGLGAAASGVHWDVVANIIMDTVAHTPTCDQSKAVLALDLSSLACSPQEFAVTNELVWLENRHLLLTNAQPRKEFDRLRKAFLQGLLAKRPLFSEEFSWLEPLAHANIESLGA